tara:strand:- start:169 stop:321 length:153 start_codon:yes stop_codon:yes gene_type:complete
MDQDHHKKADRKKEQKSVTASAQKDNERTKNSSEGLLDDSNLEFLLKKRR